MIPRSFASRLLLALAALGALAVPAFWPMYLGRPAGDVDAYTHVHAALGAAWLALLAAQALLVRGGKLGIHRALGRLSYGLAPAFVLSGFLLAHFRFSRMTEETYAHEASWLYLPLVVGSLFAVSYVFAIAWRRDWTLHARYMACTAILLVDPVAGRVMAFHLFELAEPWHYQVLTFGATTAIVWALFRGRPEGAAGSRASRAYAWLVTVMLAGFFVVAPTGAWRAFGSWFRALPLT